jgi:hypothetical protein
VAALKRAPDGKAEALFYDSIVKGASLQAGLQKALEEALAKLPIPKVMQYQLETDCELPGWSSVNFVRPAHSLIALHGSTVVPVKALGLTAGNSTQGHRFEAKVSPVVLPHADQYDEVLKRDGSVIASFAERRAEIVRQLNAAAAKVGGGAKPIEDEALPVRDRVPGCTSGMLDPHDEGQPEILPLDRCIGQAHEPFFGREQHHPRRRFLGDRWQRARGAPTLGRCQVLL